MKNHEWILQASPVLLKEDEDKFYLFFPTEKTLNYLYSLNRGKNWSKEKTVLYQKVKSFAVTLDSEDKINLVCKDMENNILFLKRKERGWEKQILLRDKNDMDTGFFSLITFQDIIHLIYLTLDAGGGSWRLMHHIQKDGLWETGKLIEGGAEIHNNYAVSSPGAGGRVHLVERRFKNGKYLLYYRTLDPETFVWSQSRLISTEIDDNFFPCLLEDCQKSLHVMWVTFSNSEYKILYRKKFLGGWPSGGWSKIFTLTLSKSNKSPIPLLSLNDPEVKSLWIKNNTVYQRISTDNGEHWKDQLKETFNHVYFLRYSPNLQLNNARDFSLLISKDFPPGNFIEDLPYAEKNKQIIVENIEPDHTAVSARKTDINLRIKKNEETEPHSVESEDLENDFYKLQGYSSKLIKYASDLYDDKERLELTLDRKEKEFSWFYKHAEEKVDQLNQVIVHKENHLKTIKNEMKDTINTIHEKLRQEKYKHKQENKILTQTINSLKGEINTLKSEIKRKEEIIGNLRKEVSLLNKELLKEKLNFLSKMKRKLFKE